MRNGWVSGSQTFLCFTRLIVSWRYHNTLRYVQMQCIMRSPGGNWPHKTKVACEPATHSLCHNTSGFLQPDAVSSSKSHKLLLGNSSYAQHWIIVKYRFSLKLNQIRRQSEASGSSYAIVILHISVCQVRHKLLQLVILRENIFFFSFRTSAWAVWDLSVDMWWWSRWTWSVSKRTKHGGR